MFSIRKLLLLVLITLPACGGSSGDVAHSGSALASAYDRAAAEWGVPVEVLKGIGWEETRWHHPPERSLIGGWGIMSLREQGSLEEAARRTGLDLESLRQDPASNIEGSAAVLRAWADWYFAEYPSRDPQRLSDWFEVVKHYSGMDDPEMAEVYGLGVFRAIHNGARRLFDDGVALSLEPTLIDVDGDVVFAKAWSYLQPDYPNAIWRSSSNYTSGRSSMKWVVIHTCQGGYSGCVSWLRNPSASASAHYVISGGGEISQLVENKNTAWHARSCVNPYSIGIEHGGFVSDPNNYTSAMYKSSAALGRWIADKYGLPKDRNTFKGHVEFQGQCGNTHTDPGPYWNWDYYMGLVRGTSTTPTTGVLTGAVFWGTNFETDKTDTSKRIVGATVKTNTGKTATTDGNGFYTFELAAGSYTVTASASGYASASKTASVTSGSTSWGSIMLAKSDASSGTVKGYVFWGEKPEDYSTNITDASKRLANATVTFSPGGKTATTDAGGLFTLALAPGTYTVNAAASGYLEHQRPEAVTVVAGGTAWGSTMVLKPGTATDTTPPTVAISAPEEGATVDLPTVQVVGTVSDQSPITAFTVGGQTATVTNGGFSVTAALNLGANAIVVEATDSAGNVGRATVNVTREGAPTRLAGLVFDAGQDEAARIIGAKVVAGDQLDVLTDEAGTFEAEVVAGTYPIIVTAAGFKSYVGQVTALDGHTTRVKIGLTAGTDDVAIPPVAITFPSHGDILTEKRVIVAGLATAPDLARVEVNGGEAALAEEMDAFTATVELVGGTNVIEAVAFDAEGEELGRASVEVTVETGCGCASSGGRPSAALLPLLGLLALRLRRRRPA